MNPIIFNYIPDRSKVLTLNLSKEAFFVTGTSEKMFELRKSSKFIIDRLTYGERGVYRSFKYYDYILLVWGYGDHRPFKLFRYGGYRVFKESKMFEFSNGLVFQASKGDYYIILKELVFTSGYSLIEEDLVK